LRVCVCVCVCVTAQQPCLSVNLNKGQSDDLEE